MGTHFKFAVDEAEDVYKYIASSSGFGSSSVFIDDELAESTENFLSNEGIPDSEVTNGRAIRPMSKRKLSAH